MVLTYIEILHELLPEGLYLRRRQSVGSILLPGLGNLGVAQSLVGVLGHV
jgi:hypothetical protein